MENRINLSNIFSNIGHWLREYARIIIAVSIISIILFGLFAVPAMVSWDREKTEYFFDGNASIPENATGTIETWTIISSEAVGHRSTTSYEVIIEGPNSEREIINVSADEYAHADKGRQIEVASYTFPASYGWRTLTFVLYFIMGVALLAIVGFGVCLIISAADCY